MRPRQKSSSKPHTEAFTKVRDRLIGVEQDADRVAIARLFGAMHEPQADLSPEAIELLRAIVALDTDGILRFQHWCRTYLSRYGQIPSAAGYKTNLRPNREVVDDS